MKGTFTTPALFLLSLLVLILTPTTVHAGSYTLTTPTSATRWTAGQPGAITLLSTDKAGASTKPTDRLLTITLRFGKGGFFGKSTQVAVIRDGIQLLVPFKGAENQVKLEVTDWMVPAGTAAGDKYFVQMVRSKDGFLDIFPDKVESAFFQIVATPVAPPPAIPPPANTTGPTPPTPTLNTTTIPLPTPTPTTPLPTTPTLPPGQTCADIQAQCAARNLTFIDTNSTAICQCGPLLIMPVIIGSGASAVGGSLMMAVVGLGLSVLMNSNLLLL